MKVKEQRQKGRTQNKLHFLCLSLLLCLSLFLTSCSTLMPSESSGEVESFRASESEGTSGDLAETESMESNPSQENSNTGSTQETEDKVPLELTLAILNPASLLPWEVTEAETAHFLLLIYEPLWNIAMDGSLEPCLAEKVTCAADGSYLDIQLKTGVSFSNHHTLSAQDVVYTVTELLSTENAFSQAVSNIDHAEQRSTNVVRLYLKTGGYMNYETMVFPIVIKDAKELLNPIGTGPYAVSKLEPGRELLLKANTLYRGTIPSIDTVRIYFVREREAILTSFDSTRCNLFYSEELDWGRYINQTTRTIHDRIGQEAVYLEFSTSGSFSDSLSNRQKVAMALDNDKLLLMGYWNRGEASGGIPFSPSSWLGNEYITEHGADAYAYDPDKASQMQTTGYRSVRIYYDPSDTVLTALVPEMEEELTEAGFLVQQVEDKAEADVLLRRGRLTFTEVARLLGQEEAALHLNSEAGAIRLAKEMCALVQAELPVYPLFFMAEGTITGYGIQGELTPGEGNPYHGAENLTEGN